MTVYKVLPSIVVQSVVNNHGQLVLEDLPFAPGDTVEIIVRGRVIEPPNESSASERYPLQGSQPYSYQDPFEPAVPAEDWEVMR
jgi:bifunctional DNA-binding transcriptional regulator/antitoxin component of YhaV-PrlF toxin-antitoxin module